MNFLYYVTHRYSEGSGPGINQGAIELPQSKKWMIDLFYSTADKISYKLLEENRKLLVWLIRH